MANLGALGVDMSSGSAAASLEGNANRFAADYGANRYQKAVGEWETRENVKAQRANAQNYENAASWYGSTVKNLGQSLLTAGVSGLVSGISAYSLAGGFGGGGDVAQAGKGFVSGSQSVLRNLQAGNILRNGLKASRR